MKLTDISTEHLKLFHSLVQQRVMFTNAHQKGSQALAHFELEVANEDRPIDLADKDREATRTALRETVKMAAEGVKFISQLEAS